MRARVRRVLPVLALAAAACELQEVTVVDFSDVLIGEVYVSVTGAGLHNVVAFLHGTAAGGSPDSESFDDASVRITRPSDGLQLDLTLTGLPACVDTLPEGATGSCFVDTGSGVLAPGDELDLTVTLADGRSLIGSATIPGDFQIDGITGTCRVRPDTLLTVRWTRSAGAWAYVNETSIEGLVAALQDEDIEVEQDPLYLLGLSISAADTTVVFPSEFGVFDRFDLDQDLALRLQRGLPDGTQADVAITAVERNYVNWARGGNFNPSGQVRVASLRGAGTGVFGAAVTRSFFVESRSGASGNPDCPAS